MVPERDSFSSDLIIEKRRQKSKSSPISIIKPKPISTQQLDQPNPDDPQIFPPPFDSPPIRLPSPPSPPRSLSHSPDWPYSSDSDWNELMYDVKGFTKKRRKKEKEKDKERIREKEKKNKKGSMLNSVNYNQSITSVTLKEKSIGLIDDDDIDEEEDLDESDRLKEMEAVELEEVAHLDVEGQINLEGRWRRRRDEDYDDENGDYIEDENELSKSQQNKKNIQQSERNNKSQLNQSGDGTFRKGDIEANKTQKKKRVAVLRGRVTKEDLVMILSSFILNVIEREDILFFNDDQCI
ncbi:MAG: hypothetical protein EZS28_011515 [Streblomastix strix]|uniref:Uncharacterized protein n=1 Tax=Streblomastix strix TaxID=222440 RepID=A0A5J4WDB3_9EUKA|nr:MAG: hypothetical protein EZS28_011515 [Streblomastix strix]